MPNLCDINIIVRGRKEAVEKFSNAISTNYNSNYDKFCRIFQSDISENDSYGLVDYQKYNVTCEWSAFCCMRRGQYSYYDDVKNDHEQSSDINVTCIEELSEKYGIEVELWSQEPGMEFEEHYHIKNGKILCDDCHEFSEVYIGKDDFNSYDEFISEYEELGSNIDELKQLIPQNRFDELREQGNDFLITKQHPDSHTFSFYGAKDNSQPKVKMCEIINNN